MEDEAGLYLTNHQQNLMQSYRNLKQINKAGAFNTALDSLILSYIKENDVTKRDFYTDYYHYLSVENDYIARKNENRGIENA